MTPRARILLALPLVPLLAVAACEREERRFGEVPPGASAAQYVVQNDDNQAGPMIVDPEIRNAYDENAWAIAEGKVLYESFNCAGCHSPGGGGAMGPPLIDSLWTYGSEPENVFETIVQGRPRGMPSYRGRLGNAEVWKLAAYVRYLGGFTRQDTRSARDDHMRGTTIDPQSGPPSARRSGIPPESRPPVAPAGNVPAAPDTAIRDTTSRDTTIRDVTRRP